MPGQPGPYQQRSPVANVPAALPSIQEAGGRYGAKGLPARGMPQVSSWW